MQYWRNSNVETRRIDWSFRVEKSEVDLSSDVGPKALDFDTKFRRKFKEEGELRWCNLRFRDAQLWKLRAEELNARHVAFETEVGGAKISQRLDCLNGCRLILWIEVAVCRFFCGCGFVFNSRRKRGSNHRFAFFPLRRSSSESVYVYIFYYGSKVRILSSMTSKSITVKILQSQSPFSSSLN